MTASGNEDVSNESSHYIAGGSINWHNHIVKMFLII